MGSLMNTLKKSQLIGAILAIFILAGMFFVPESIGLNRSGINTLGLLIALLILLITEPIPIGITCMLGVSLMVVFGVVKTIPEALSGYTNQILFFVLVSFGISYAITKVPLSKRILVFLIHIFGTKSNNILLALMLCAAILSSIMSNTATTAVLISVIINFLHVFKENNEQKQVGRAFMIALPIASMIGGMMTPAGSSLNLLTMDYLEKLAGIRITFVQWMVIGIPMGIVMILFAWIIIAKVFKPMDASEERIKEYIKELDIPKKLSFSEKYVAAVILTMLVLWILSSWIKALNITVVGTIGLAFLFLPKIRILEWHEYTENVSWASYFLIGTMMSLGSALSANGVSIWLINLLFPEHQNLPVVLLTFLICLVIFLLLLPIPIAPALLTMLIAPFIDLAHIWNISPILLALPLVLCASNSFLLPLDTVPLLTYTTGYYKMSDMPKVSVAIQLVLAAVIAIWLPVAINILHLA